MAFVEDIHMQLLTVPAVLTGALCGVWLCGRISELDYRRARYILLIIAGIGRALSAFS